MVRLFNIMLNNNTISCDYEPEKSGKSGHITVSLKTQEILNIQFSEYEYGKKIYVSCAYFKLLEILKFKTEIPKETFAICF